MTATGIARARALADEVGPEFELDEADGVGFHGVEEAAHGAGEIQGVPNNAGARRGRGGVLLEEFPGAGDAGVGADGDDDVGVWGEEGDEAAEGVHFADGDGVEEEARAFGGGERGRVAETGAPVAAGLPRPDGGGDGGGECVGDVEGVHGARRGNGQAGTRTRNLSHVKRTLWPVELPARVEGRVDGRRAAARPARTWERRYAELTGGRRVTGELPGSGCQSG